MRILLFLISLTLIYFFCLFHLFAAHLPWARNKLHHLINKKSYQLLYSEWVNGECIGCFQCGAIEQVDLDRGPSTVRRHRIACARCKTLLWRQQDSINSSKVTDSGGL